MTSPVPIECRLNVWIGMKHSSSKKFCRPVKLQSIDEKDFRPDSMHAMELAYKSFLRVLLGAAHEIVESLDEDRTVIT